MSFFTTFEISTGWPAAQWLAETLARVTILLAAAGLADALARRAPAASRHLIWSLALAGALILPAASALTPTWELPLALPRVQAPSQPAATSNVIDSDSGDRLASAWMRNAPAFKHGQHGQHGTTDTAVTSAPQKSAVSSVPLVVLCWLAGVAIVLLRVGAGNARVLWLTRRHCRAAGGWRSIADRLAGEIGLGTRVRFLETSGPAMPMAWGILHPVVVLPAGAARWDDERVRLVVLHELAHVRRRDCLTQLLAQIACAVYWFHPLAWIAARRLQIERERACDDVVLAAGARHTDYASHLLEIARAMRSSRVVAWGAVSMAHRSQLEGRLMAILDEGVRRRLPRAGAVLTVTMAGILVFGLASAQPRAVRPASAPAAVSGAAVPAAMPPASAPEGSERAALVDAQRPQPQPDPKPVLAPSMTVGPGWAQAERADRDAQQDATPVLASRDGHKTPSDPRIADALISALKDSDAEVREHALQALSEMRDPRVFQPLVDAMTDQSADVREKAAFALGQFRDARAIEPLTAAARDASASVREQAVFALGQLRDARSVAPLAAALSDANASVREQAAFALGQIRNPASVDPLVRALKDTSPSVREQAAFALGETRDARALDGLVAALKDENASVREQAAFALGELRDRRAVEGLIGAVQDAQPDVRQQAVFALGEIRDPRAVDALTLALKDTNAEVRQQAAYALGQLARH